MKCCLAAADSIARCIAAKALAPSISGSTVLPAKPKRRTDCQ